MEGLVNAGNSFSAKIGNGLAPAIISWMLTLGYIAGQITQSAAEKIWLFPSIRFSQQ